MGLPREVKEKLEALIGEAVKEASEKAVAQLDKAREEALKAIEKSYNEALKEAREEIERIKRRTEVESRKKSAAAEIKARHMILEAKEKLLEEVIERAKSSFREIVGDEAYKKFMLSLLRIARSSLGGDRIVVAPTSRDLDLIEKVVSESDLKDVLEVTEETVEGHGGFIARTPDGRSRVDLTLNSIFEAQKDTVRMRISKIIFEE